MAGVGEAREQVFVRQPRIASQEVCLCLAGSQEIQDEFDGQASAEDDWFAREYFGIGFDSLAPVHEPILPGIEPLPANI